MLANMLAILYAQKILAAFFEQSGFLVGGCA